MPSSLFPTSRVVSSLLLTLLLAEFLLSYPRRLLVLPILWMVPSVGASCGLCSPFFLSPVRLFFLSLFPFLSLFILLPLSASELTVPKLHRYLTCLDDWNQNPL